METSNIDLKILKNIFEIFLTLQEISPNILKELTVTILIINLDLITI